MKKNLIWLLLLGALSSAAAQEPFEKPKNNIRSQYIPSPENLAAREWFKKAKFGLFIHWGIYSVLGDGEWVMNNQNISIENYKKLPGLFNPTAFDAKKWVAMAKEAGMKYITITARHHDGFSMFDSQASDYNIVKKTPFKRDVLKELAAACNEADIKLFFYYSTLDWYRDDYFPRGRTGLGIKGRGEGNWEDYLSFMKAQLTELLTNYGPIGGIWFDGHWDQMAWDGNHFSKPQVDWRYEELYGLIHRLQPAALIGNNHHMGVIPGEDFQMFEKDLPGKNTTGWATSADQISSLPLEVCETINGSWGFNLQDENHKSPTELIHYLVKAAGYGSNLLLNVGPMPNGEIQNEHKESLAAIGGWLKVYGNSIRETTKGPIPPNESFSITKKDNILYLHVLDKSTSKLYIEKFPVTIKSMKSFESNENLSYKNDRFGLVIDLENLPMNKIDRIITIKI